MIIEIKETNYKGILIERVDDQGWKCNLGGQEYLFPNFVAAQTAINEIFRDIKPIIAKNGGKKFKGFSEAGKREKSCEALLSELRESIHADDMKIREIDRILDDTESQLNDMKHF